jgi:rod shape determining protein RodA
MAFKSDNQFGRLVIAGSAPTIFIHVFINVAMVTALVPVVGVPLPLGSYCGTSMVTIKTGIGLAASAGVHGQESVRRASLGALL